MHADQNRIYNHFGAFMFSKPTQKPKHANHSRVFWIFLLNVIKIDQCNFELYRFKVGAFFWDTVYTLVRHFGAFMFGARYFYSRRIWYKKLAPKTSARKWSRFMTQTWVWFHFVSAVQVMSSDITCSNKLSVKPKYARKLLLVTMILDELGTFRSSQNTLQLTGNWE